MEAPPALIWPYPVFILGLHLFWFHGWVKGQRRRWVEAAASLYPEQPKAKAP